MSTTPAPAPARFTPEAAEMYHRAMVDLARASDSPEQMHLRCAALWGELVDDGRDSLAAGWVAYLAAHLAANADPDALERLAR